MTTTRAWRCTECYEPFTAPDGCPVCWPAHTRRVEVYVCPVSEAYDPDVDWPPPPRLCIPHTRGDIIIPVPVDGLVMSYDPVDWARDTAEDVIIGHEEPEATFVIREKLWRLIEEGWEVRHRGTYAAAGYQFGWQRNDAYGFGYAPTLTDTVDAAWAAREATS